MGQALGQCHSPQRLEGWLLLECWQSEGFVVKEPVKGI
jgi:hypothetical protein